ncbi:MAG: hypothetical protein AB1648_10240 [Pseudomonadota bacterium]
MRRVTRPPLGKGIQAYLCRRQKQADEKYRSGGLDVEREWKGARATKTMRKVLTSLQNMMGARERCMYCLDSHGSDIEHFRPKAGYSKRMFRWRNLLLCCTECGRLKGNRFPLQGKRPLLIDPTKEEPWRHLDFDPITGNITARFDAQINVWSPKGTATVEILQLDRREALAAGYKATFQRLSDIARRFLADSDTPYSQFIDALREADDHGLLGWIFVGTGRNEPPFSELWKQRPAVWNECAHTLKFN